MKNFQSKFSNPNQEGEPEERKVSYEEKAIKESEPEYIPQNPVSQYQSNSQPDIYQPKPIDQPSNNKRSSLADFEGNQSNFVRKPAEQQQPVRKNK